MSEQVEPLYLTRREKALVTGLLLVRYADLSRVSVEIGADTTSLRAEYNAIRGKIKSMKYEGESDGNG